MREEGLAAGAVRANLQRGCAHALRPRAAPGRPHAQCGWAARAAAVWVAAWQLSGWLLGSCLGGCLAAVWVAAWQLSGVAALAAREGGAL